MKGLKPKLIFAFFAFHFTVMALGMAKVHVASMPFIEQTIFWYSRVTGAGGGFGFFSPDIPQEVMLSFDVETDDGKTVHTTLQEMTVPEVRFRLGNMIRLMMKTYKNERVVRSIAASLASRVFMQYPNAKTVTLEASIHEFPSMDQYREGKRTELKKIYTVQFGRKKS